MGDVYHLEIHGDVNAPINFGGGHQSLLEKFIAWVKKHVLKLG